MLNRNLAGQGWRVNLENSALIVHGPEQTLSFEAGSQIDPSLKWKWFRWVIQSSKKTQVVLRGIDRDQRASLRTMIKFLPFLPKMSEVIQWKELVLEGLDRGVTEGRWIPRELLDSWLGALPPAGLLLALERAGLADHLPDEWHQALEFSTIDLTQRVESTNAIIMANELEEQSGFLATIEKSPLTLEQSQAVICFDNRVQVLAAAGSGKTSVMVTRAAYAVKKRFTHPDRILLLAFNSDAASELEMRAREAFRAAGIDSGRIKAHTFHALGRRIIAQSTGEKPSVAPWVKNEASTRRKILEIVDELAKADESFRYNWDLFRLIYPDAPAEPNITDFNAWDKESKKGGYLTASGDIVKSEGERKIADFLFFNHIEFQYEKPYEKNVATTEHQQYRPDFYYPEIDLWHEHWALDRNGKPPKAFYRYRESMSWKRKVHAQNQTQLIESTWYDVVFGRGIHQLQEGLAERGITGHWDPDREVQSKWYQAMDKERLAGFIRTFLSHAKANSWTKEDLEERIKTDLRDLDNYRTHLFLQIYWPIHNAWDEKLAIDRYIDFEDMLLEAANCLENGTYASPYDLILVDEFQDSSQARARLLKGLLQGQGRFLLGVGDDWQSINRFAGADVSIMTKFHENFGAGPSLSITKTFRCPDPISHHAARFVTKNPLQLKKKVDAETTTERGIQVHRTNDPAAEIVEILERLGRSLASGRISVPEGRKLTVDVLGRYNHFREIVPSRLPDGIELKFRTVHRSKGLEADFVIIPGMTAGVLGFPSLIEDDPLLKMAMPDPEGFDFAEDRRLFYVALTRAKRSVYLLTEPSNVSPFIAELKEMGAIDVDKGGDAPLETCPRCGVGVLHLKSGQYGSFRTCSRWPSCDFSRSLTTRLG